jgi:hypothetical protein
MHVVHSEGQGHLSNGILHDLLNSSNLDASFATGDLFNHLHWHLAFVQESLEGVMMAQLLYGSIITGLTSAGWYFDNEVQDAIISG